MTFVRVASAREIPPGAARRVSVAGRMIALFNLGGSFYALDDRCPHEGGFLSLGTLDGSRVSCPVHGAVFDLCTGQALEPPAGETTPLPAVRVHRARVIGTEVEVEIGDTGAGDGPNRGIQIVLEL